MSLLAAEPFDFAYCHRVYAGFCQGITNGFHFERSDNRLNFFIRFNFVPSRFYRGEVQFLIMAKDWSASEPMRFEQEVSEAKIAAFAAPEPPHSF
jgi:hypothetical protein